MKIIKPSVEINYPTKASNPIKWIESCGRICYKSEDKITEDSGKKMISNLIKSGHLSVLEHFRFIVRLSPFYYCELMNASPELIKHFNFTRESARCIVSTNARALLETYNAVESPIHSTLVSGTKSRDMEIILSRIIGSIISHYNCKELFPEMESYDAEDITIMSPYELTAHEYLTHGWFTVKFICDRGVSHEIVRHRVMSFSQESTRYCNYDKDKFGKEITVIEPCFWKKNSEEYKLWEKTQRYIEEMYLQLIHAGAAPQQARTVLTNSVKTEIAVTGSANEFMHFLYLRCSKAAHPQIRELALPLLKLLYNKEPTVFDVVYNEFKEEF